MDRQNKKQRYFMPKYSRDSVEEANAKFQNPLQGPGGF